MRDRLIGIIKLVVAVGIVAWLVDSGRIDFAKLSIFITEPLVLAAGVTQFIFVTAMLTGSRWRLLLVGAGINLGFIKVFSLQMIGMFFNVAMPGSVGGDIVKALYVIKDNKNIPKTRVMMTVLLDRIMGMAGVFSLGLIGIFWNYSLLMQSDQLRPLAIMVFVAVLTGLVLMVFVMGPHSEKMEAIVSRLRRRGLIGFGLIAKILDALSMYRGRYKILFVAWAASLVVQITAMSYFAFIASAMLDDPLDFTMLMVVFPIGALISALPIAPGGIGVGHLAFDQLFAMFGKTGGADVFNVFLLGNMGLGLAGIVPYLLHRSEKQGVGDRAVASKTVSH